MRLRWNRTGVAAAAIRPTPIPRLLFAATLVLASLGARANDQAALDNCIASWGAKSPFPKGTPAHSVLATGVKVFGLGQATSGDDPVTSKPALVLVRPAVNVMGKNTIRLANPNGWYCFRSNVTVAGKIEIEAQCTAQIASARESGTSVGATDESNKGVAVFGALRVTRFGCP
ncbi:MAG: hypothetical protein IPJ28_05915 [Betaproteobacteria bacterium]|nr:hypothetical protein [Betaproteobacteria bacterium]